ncbi:hypothetical protein KSS87_001600 [Heliosperma pusillum]|nr:hypothetical protein KSS87_001600 [Heliosperma pusillum]
MPPYHVTMSLSTLRLQMPYSTSLLLLGGWKMTRNNLSSFVA